MLARRIGLGVAAWVVAATSLVVFVTRPERVPDCHTDERRARSGSRPLTGTTPTNTTTAAGSIATTARPRPTSATITTPATPACCWRCTCSGDLPTADRGTEFALQRLHPELGGAAFGDGRTFDTGAERAARRRRSASGASTPATPSTTKTWLISVTSSSGWSVPTARCSRTGCRPPRAQVGTLSFSTGEAVVRAHPSRAPLPRCGMARARRARRAVHHAAPRRRREHLPADLRPLGRVRARRDAALGDAAVVRPHRDDRRVRERASPGSSACRCAGSRNAPTRASTCLLRGHQALPSGLGTLGEGLGALARYETARGRPGEAVAIRDRMQCAVGMLVARQDTSADPQRERRVVRLEHHTDGLPATRARDARRVWLTSPPRRCSSKASRSSRRPIHPVCGRPFPLDPTVVPAAAVACGDGDCRSGRPRGARDHHCSICST